MCISPLHEPKYTGEIPTWFTLGLTTHIPDINWKKWLSCVMWHVHMAPLLFGLQNVPHSNPHLLYFISHFTANFFLCQEVLLDFVRVSELPKYLVHLPDGIYRVTSPILKSKHMSYAVAKKNEKCQNVHTLVPPFGSLSSTTVKAGFH